MSIHARKTHIIQDQVIMDTLGKEIGIVEESSRGLAYGGRVLREAQMPVTHEDEGIAQSTTKVY